MKPVVVNQDLSNQDTGLWCEIDGVAVELGLPNTCVHYLANSTRPCIHGPATFPRACLFDRMFVEHLNFQAIFFDRIAVPVIASRRDRLVTVAINSHHPINERRPHSGSRKAPRCLDADNQWTYRMIEMQWWDEDEVDDLLWLGVWP